MSRKIIATVIAAVLLTLSLASYAQAYRLGAGDVIRIDVYDEPDLTFARILIGSKGVISFPFVGDISITGETTASIEQMLISGLKPDYLVNPRITVSVLEYRPFFINGEVASPGGIAYSPGLTLRKAISLAGGFTERASRTNITVISEQDIGEKSTKVGMDYKVQPGDVITVEQSFF